MLKIEAIKLGLIDLRAVPFVGAAGNALGGGRNRGLASALTVA